MKNRTIIGIFCIILAVTVMFGISPIINKMASGKTEVIQLKKPIEQGQIITKDDIAKVQIGSLGLKSGFIKEINQIVGKYAAGKLFPNINIYPEMLLDKTNTAENVFKTLDGTKQAISISIPSFANGLSGKLQNGDIVSIIVVNGSESTVPAQLNYVRVITATTTKGEDSDNLKVKDDGSTDMPSTVTLLVNATQAKLLALYDETSKIHISLVYRGEKETAEKFDLAQDKVIASEVK